MADPQVVWLGHDAYGEKWWIEEKTEEGYKPAIVMTPKYRAELRKLVDDWRYVTNDWGVQQAIDAADGLDAAIEKMLEATE